MYICQQRRKGCLLESLSIDTLTVEQNVRYFIYILNFLMSHLLRKFMVSTMYVMLFSSLYVWAVFFGSVLHSSLLFDVNIFTQKCFCTQH